MNWTISGSIEAESKGAAMPWFRVKRRIKLVPWEEASAEMRHEAEAADRRADECP